MNHLQLSYILFTIWSKYHFERIYTGAILHWSHCLYLFYIPYNLIWFCSCHWVLLLIRILKSFSYPVSPVVFHWLSTLNFICHVPACTACVSGSFCNILQTNWVLSVLQSFVSSAKTDTLLSIPTTRSLIKRVKRIGPNTDPCGISLLILDHFKCVPFAMTFCFLSHYQLLKHAHTLPPSPCICSFSTRLFCGTILNAFIKFRYITSATWLASRCPLMYVLKLSMWLRPDLLFLNPCWLCTFKYFTYHRVKLTGQ